MEKIVEQINVGVGIIGELKVAGFIKWVRLMNNVWDATE